MNSELRISQVSFDKPIQNMGKKESNESAIYSEYLGGEGA